MVGLVEGATAAQWVLPVLTELNSQNQKILKNQKKILEELGEIKDDIDKVEANLGEQIFRQARTGMRHLLEGINSDVEQVREDNFQLARQKFTELVELDPNEETKGTSGKLANKFLITVGYWGSFHYFNLLGDQRSATIQVYECIQKWIEWGDPVFGLEWFSPNFFSMNYAELIREINNQLVEIQEAFRRMRFYSLSQWVGLPIFVGTSMLGIGGLVVLGLFGASAVTGGVSYLIERLKEKDTDYQTRKKIEEARNKRIAAYQAEGNKSLKKKYKQLCEQRKNLYLQLNDECQTRQKSLQNITLGQLLNLGWKSKIHPFVNQIESTLEQLNYKIPNTDKVMIEGQA